MPIPTPISDHNAPLPPDELTSLQLNFEWRRLIVELLWELQFEDFWSGTKADIEAAVNKASEMIECLYKGDCVAKFAARIGTTITHDLPGVGLTFAEFSDPTTTLETYDFGGFWDVANPARLTVPAGGAGIYVFSAFAFFDTAPRGLRTIALRKSPFSNVAQSFHDTENFWSISISGQIEMDAGDFVELIFSSEEALTVFTSPRVSLIRIQK